LPGAKYREPEILFPLCGARLNCPEPLADVANVLRRIDARRADTEDRRGWVRR
jgi:hypothetical protein